LICDCRAAWRDFFRQVEVYATGGRLAGDLSRKEPMKKLIEVVQDAGRNCVAIGHFNIADLVLLKGIFEAARELNVPVIVGASEGEREFAGTRQLAALVRSLREEFDYPIFLNADHTHSLAGGLEAVNAGFDSVVFDLSTLPLEENAQSTKQAVEAFKSMNPTVVSRGARTRWCRTRSFRRPSPRSTTSCARGFDYSEGRTKDHFRLWPSGTEHERRCIHAVAPRFGFRLIDATLILLA
jgi:hypothetical protein